jgi:hypothetical protein
MICESLCLNCSLPQTKKINFSKFHGACDNCKIFSKIFRCFHCKAIVPFIFIQDQSDESPINKTVTESNSKQDCIDLPNKSQDSSIKLPFDDYYCSIDQKFLNQHNPEKEVVAEKNPDRKDLGSNLRGEFSIKRSSTQNSDYEMNQKQSETSFICKFIKGIKSRFELKLYDFPLSLLEINENSAKNESEIKKGFGPNHKNDSTRSNKEDK